jgi:hypothetical protein
VVGDPADTAWYRAMAALVHAFVVALTLTRLRALPFGALSFVTLLTPAAWFLFGVVNPNSLEIALALLGWVGVARFIDHPAPTAGDAWWIAAPMALSIVVRPIAIVTAVAMLLIVELRRRPGPRRWILVTPVALAVAGVVAWHMAVDVQLDDPRTAVHRSWTASAGDSIGSLPTTAIEAVRSLGWNEFQAPMPASIAWATMWVALTVAAVIAARRRNASRLLLAVGVWLVALMATPVVFESAMAGSVGPIWQGRYSLPVVIGLALFVQVPQAPRRVINTVVAVAVLIDVTTYWSVVHRYAVGSDGSWLLDDAFRSTAVLGPRTWIAVHVAAVVAAAVLIVLSTTERGSVDVAEDVDDDVGRARVVVHVE